MAGTAAGAAKAREALVRRAAERAARTPKVDSSTASQPAPVEPAPSTQQTPQQAEQTQQPDNSQSGSTVATVEPVAPPDEVAAPIEFARQVFEMAAPEAAVYVLKTMRNPRAPTALRFAAAKHILDQAGTAKRRGEQPADSQAALLALAERVAQAARRRGSRAEPVTVDQQPERPTEGNSRDSRPHGTPGATAGAPPPGGEAAG